MTLPLLQIVITHPAKKPTMSSKAMVCSMATASYSIGVNPPNSDVKTRYYYHCDRFKKYQSKATTLNTSTRTTVLSNLSSSRQTTTSGSWRFETSITTTPDHSIPARIMSIIDVHQHRKTQLNQ